MLVTQNYKKKKKLSVPQSLVLFVICKRWQRIEKSPVSRNVAFTCLSKKHTHTRKRGTWLYRQSCFSFFSGIQRHQSLHKNIQIVLDLLISIHRHTHKKYFIFWERLLHREMDFVCQSFVLEFRTVVIVCLDTIQVEQSRVNIKFSLYCVTQWNNNNKQNTKKWTVHQTTINNWLRTVFFFTIYIQEQAPNVVNIKK